MRDRCNCAWLVVGATLTLALTTPAAADKLDDIKARGRLLVGVTESSPPFSFRDDGKGIVGYDVDLAERVAKNLGVTTEKSPSSTPSAFPPCSRTASISSPSA